MNVPAALLLSVNRPIVNVPSSPGTVLPHAALTSVAPSVVSPCAGPGPSSGNWPSSVADAKPLLFTNVSNCDWRNPLIPQNTWLGLESVPPWPEDTLYTDPVPSVILISALVQSKPVGMIACTSLVT